MNRGLFLLALLSLLFCHAAVRLTAAAAETGVAVNGQIATTAAADAQNDRADAAAEIAAAPVADAKDLDVDPVPVLPAPVHCGEVVRVERTVDRLRCRDLNRMLVERKFEVTDADDESTVVERAPGDGNVFVIVAIEIRPGLTLGRYDFTLHCAGRPHSCLGIKVGLDPFDARVWQIAAPEGPKTAHLLYEVPAETEQGLLEFALPVTVPQPPTLLRFAAAAPDKRDVRESPPRAASETGGETGAAPAEAAAAAAVPDTAPTRPEAAAAAAVPAKRAGEASKEDAPAKKGSIESDWF